MEPPESRMSCVGWVSPGLHRPKRPELLIVLHLGLASRAAFEQGVNWPKYPEVFKEQQEYHPQ